MVGPVFSKIQAIVGTASNGSIVFIANGNPTDFVNVRLTDGTNFYTAQGSGGSASTNVNVVSFGGSAVTIGQQAKSNSISVTLASDQGATSVSWSNQSVFVQNASDISITTSPSVNISSFGGTSTTLGQKSMAASMPVTIASDQGAITIQGSNISIAQLPTANVSITGQPINVNASQNGVWNIGTVTNVSNATITSMPTTNVSVTGQPLSVNASQNGAWFTTSNVSNTVSVTGSNISIAQLPTITNNMGSFGGTSVTLGQKSMAASMPVTIASDQSALTITGSNLTIAQMPTTNVSVTGQPITTNATATVTNTVTVTGSALTIAQAPTTTVTQSIPSNFVAQIDNSSWGGTSTTLGQKSMAASVPVTIASDQSVLSITGSNISIAQLPTLTANIGSYGGTATTIGQKAAAASIPVVVANNQVLNANVNLDSVGGSAFTLGQKTAPNSISVVFASGVIPTFAATQSGTWNIATVTTVTSITNIVTTSDNIASYGGTSTTLGQKSMAASMPVTMASDQTAFGVNASQSGTWNINAVTSITNTVTVSGSNLTIAQLPTITDNIGSYGGTATSLGQKAMSSSIPVTLASDQAPARLATVQVLAATTFNNTVSTATSTPQLVSGYKYVGLYYTVSKAGAPTDVLISPQFLNNSSGTFADIGYGYLQDLRFSNAAIGSGIKEYVVHEAIDNYVQYVVVGTGLSSANTITTTLSLSAWN